MTHISSYARLAFGLVCFGAALAVTYFCLVLIGWVTQFTLPGRSDLSVAYVLTATIGLPFVVLGMHTIFWRARRDPAVNYRAMRAVEIILATALGVMSLAYFAFGITTGLAILLLSLLVSGTCWILLRNAPGGVSADGLPGISTDPQSRGPRPN